MLKKDFIDLSYGIKKLEKKVDNLKVECKCKNLDMAIGVNIFTTILAFSMITLKYND
jgi:hypothetical protein